MKHEHSPNNLNAHTIALKGLVLVSALLHPKTGQTVQGLFKLAHLRFQHTSKSDTDTTQIKPKMLCSKFSSLSFSYILDDMLSLHAPSDCKKIRKQKLKRHALPVTVCHDSQPVVFLTFNREAMGLRL